MIPKIQEYFKTQPVLRAWLFGSCSRGEETPDSDVDILVNYDFNHRISLLTIGGMMARLEEKLGREVDLVEEEGLLKRAQRNVNKDKILIYERQ